MTLWRFLLACTAALVLTGCVSGTQPAAEGTPVAQRQNVLVIVADDLGFSDIAPYGGEIATPNLSRLAQRGIRLTQLHSAPSCSPSRAMLFSGTDSHVAGLGAMAEAIPPHYRGQEGFEGVLSSRVASLAERFAEAGYRTAMAGKWHLGMEQGQRPAQRGFSSSFALMQGASNHFGAGGFGGDGDGIGGATYLLNDTPWTPGPDFYSSDVFTSMLIDQLEGGNDETPFFAYLSFTAPHSPLQALPQDIARYADTYADGWGALARRRVEGMQQAGILQPRLPDADAIFVQLQSQWDALSSQQQAVEARRMAIYAAMVDRMDHNIGRLLDALERAGELDNTTILFISDNGPAGEDPRQYAVVSGFSETYGSADNSHSSMGSAASFVLQDPRWASAIAAPSRLFKGFVTEGGTRVPGILVAPGVSAGAISYAVTQFPDIAPTLLALASVPATDNVGGRSVAAITGTSFVPSLFDAAVLPDYEPIAFGFNGQGLVRFGQWKAIRLVGPLGDGQWHLYNTADDPGELHDRQDAEPALFDTMMEVWQNYVREHGLNEAADLGQVPMADPVPQWERVQ